VFALSAAVDGEIAGALNRPGFARAIPLARRERVLEYCAMLDLFRDLEEKLLRQETRNSPGEVASLLHPDFFEFGGSGTVWNRQQTIDRLAQEHLMERSLTNLSVLPLAPDVTLVTYRAVGRDVAGGNEWHSLRSSIWKLTDGRWQVIFHQGTPAQAPQP
jgi:hypothetical protein